MEAWIALLLHYDSLALLICFSPHFTLLYIENHVPVKLYTMLSLLEDLTLVYLSYLKNTPV